MRDLLTLIRYAISDRFLFSGDERSRRLKLVSQAVALAGQGVDYFQVRERDLDRAALFALACEIRDAVLATSSAMRIVLNGPRELAERAGVGWHRSSSTHVVNIADGPCLSCSVHSMQAVEAERSRSGLLLFAPVFGKTLADGSMLPAAGLQALSAAVRQAGATPVLALGGVTQANTQSCMEAGAAGVAGIRLFLPAAS